MKKDKRVAGCYSFISKDESVLATFSRNTVYIHSLKTEKLINKFKSLSNISCAAISTDQQKIAVKNTSGIIALHDLKTGDELFRNSMFNTEGEQIFFSNDDKYVFDIDRGGRFMLFNCHDGSCVLLDNKKVLPRCDYIQIDNINKLVYRFMRKEEGYSSGIIQSYNIDEKKLNPEFVDFENINSIKKNSLIDKWNISLCRYNNYYYDGKNIIKTDKNFNTAKKLKFKKEKEIVNLWVSENENFALVDYGYIRDVKNFSLAEMKNAPCLSVLYDFATMKKIKEFDYPYIADFKMLKNGKEYIISTWNGTFIGEI